MALAPSQHATQPLGLTPLPPLDGGMLWPESPERWRRVKEALARYSAFAIVLVFVIPIPSWGVPLGGAAIDAFQMALLSLVL